MINAPLKCALALVPLALLAGCGQQTNCLVGTSLSCACTDGRSGAQTCQLDGTVSACACTGGAGGGGAAGGAGGGAGGTASGGGGVNGGGAADGGALSPDGGSAGPDGGNGAPQKHIFVTSMTYGSNLGGLTGADAKCRTLATAASLGGTWKAWLSTTSTNAIDRIVDVGPWYLMNGVKTFNNKAALRGTPLVPISLDEYGN